LQWLQNPSQINGDNLNNVRCETSRTFRNRRRVYLKEEIKELETDSENRNIIDLYRGVNEFKKGYQLRINLVKDKNGDHLQIFTIFWTDKWIICQLFCVCGINNVRQTEMHVTEPFVSEPSPFEIEIAIEKLKR